VSGGLAVAATTWVAAWLGNWPAAMSPDSMNQWAQVLGGRYDDWHPVVHTLFLRVATHIWFSPAAVVAVQIIAMLTVATLAVVVLARRGVGAGWLCLVLAGFAHPAQGAMLSVLWKDVPFAISLLAFTVSLALACEREPRHPRTTYALLVLSGLGVALFRHNGFVVALAGWGGAVVAQPAGSRGRVMLALSAFLLAYGGSRLAVWQLLGAPRPRATEVLAIPLQQVGAIVAGGGRITAPQQEQVSALLPVSEWRSHYHPRSVDEIKFLPDFHADVLSAQAASYARLWVELCWANPGLAVLGWVRQTSVAWVPLQNAVSTYPEGVVPNPFGLKADPPLPHLTEAMTGLHRGFMRAPLAWIARPGIFNWALLALGVIVWRRAGWADTAPLLPALAGTGLLLLLIPVPDFRFFYPTFVVLPWLCAYACGRPHARCTASDRRITSTVSPEPAAPLAPLRHG
jgi:hypothetical protein